MTPDIRPGPIAWQDLTGPDAMPIRDFYAEVASWLLESVDMDGYADYSIVPRGGGMPVAGFCYAAPGVNAGLPPTWFVTINVPDPQAALKACLEQGGDVSDRPGGEASAGRMAVIRDPAGAHAATYEPASSQPE